MRMRACLKQCCEQLTGLWVQRPQHGVRALADIKSTRCPIRMMFDVGANVGQTARQFCDAFPGAVVHCFEPVEATFSALEANVVHEPRVQCHQLALGNAVGEAAMFVTANNTMSSLRAPSQFLRRECVQVSTVDAFCVAHEVPRIDVLKIDAEGHDLEVLQGAADMLHTARVAFVITEVGFIRGDCRHVLFDDVRDLLHSAGFHVAGFYGQQPEWSGEPRLRFANALFSNERAFSR